MTAKVKNTCRLKAFKMLTRVKSALVILCEKFSLHCMSKLLLIQFRHTSKQSKLFIALSRDICLIILHKAIKENKQLSR